MYLHGENTHFTHAGYVYTCAVHSCIFFGVLYSEPIIIDSIQPHQHCTLSAVFYVYSEGWDIG